MIRPFSLGRLAALVAVTLGFTSASQAAPKVQVDPMVIDLGTIDEGNSFERFLEVKNVGDGVLVVEEVKTSCGCTAAAVDGTTELKAGQSQKVKVTFNSKGQQEGDITKKLTVTTNDPAQKSTEVTLKAKIHVPVRWNPKYLQLDAVNPKAGFEKVVSVQADGDLKLGVKDAFIVGGKTLDQPSQLFDVKQLPSKTVEGRSQFDFTIKLRPGAKPQKISEQLVVLTNLSAGKDTLRLPIRGDLVGRLGFNVQFGAIPLAEPGAESVRDVEIKSKEGTFKVLKAEVPDSPVQVKIINDPAGNKVTLRLKYVGEAPGTNGIRQLKVETDDPDQPMLEIPVRYQTATTGKGGAPSGAAGNGANKTGPKASAKG